MGTFELFGVGTPSIYQDNGTWYVFYHGYDGVDTQIGLATANVVDNDYRDLLHPNLTRVANNPIIPTSNSGWDSGTTGIRSRIFVENSYYYMAFEASTEAPYNFAKWTTSLARSLDLIHWQKLWSPVLPQTIPDPNPPYWSFGNDAPEMLVVGGNTYIYYRYSNSGGYGSNWTKRALLTTRSPDIESIVREQIMRHYYYILKREASQSEVDFWFDDVIVTGYSGSDGILSSSEAKAALMDLPVYFFNSDEYELQNKTYRDISNATLQDMENYVIDLYHTVINRPLTQSDLDYWVGELVSGSKSPSQALDPFFVDSQEAQDYRDRLFEGL